MPGTIIGKPTILDPDDEGPCLILGARSVKIDRPMLGPAFLLAGRRRGKAAKQRGAFGRLGSSHFPHDLAGLDGADVTARLPVGVVRIAKAIDNGIEDIARLGELLRFEQFAPFPGADKVHRMMPERMNAVAVAVAVRHAIAGDLDP
jgi:hypothetical protein